MGAIDERREAGRLLAGLENGGMTAADAANLAERLDPVLNYLIVNFLRAVYPASDPAAGAVLERVVRLTSSSPAVVRRYEEGKQDPVSHWFEDVHSYGDFRGRNAELIDVIVDKLET